MTSPRIRRNIGDLSSEELSNYVYALKRLYAISDSDPTSIDGYTYFEQLHDGDLGPCEHANDTFLPWHRAHLYLFEEALRRADPPRTSNVTIPYWDWSALPSGVRYPKPFEDMASLLFNPTRAKEPICRGSASASCDRLPFPRHNLEASVLSVATWSAVTTDPNFGGFAGGESQCNSAFGDGYGALEEPVHNTMHGGYIAGDMADPSMAALDPIFWSFHCYIDLLWWQWQQMPGHVVNTGLDSRLCGLYKDRDHEPQNRFRVRDVLDPTSQLQYTYDYTRRDVPASPPIPGQLFATHPAVDFVLSGRRDHVMVRSLEVAVPQLGFNRARLNFAGVQVMPPLSYSADIYLVPDDEEFQPHNTQFRERYLVDLLYIWKAHNHHRKLHRGPGGHNAVSGQHDMVVDITKPLGELALHGDVRRWKVWVAVAIDSPDHAPIHLLREALKSTSLNVGFRDVTLTIE